MQNKALVTEIHHNESEGWHVDVYPQIGQFTFTIQAPKPDDPNASAWLIELKSILRLEGN